MVRPAPRPTPTSTFTVDADGAGARLRRRRRSASASTPARPALQAGAFTRFSLDVTRARRPAVPVADLAAAAAGPARHALQRRRSAARPTRPQGTCPAASRIGTATTAAGAGHATRSSLSGPVYLTGPYNGAPFGLSIAIRAIAGPYDLGTVVVRSAIRVDPGDAHLTIDTDPLPTIVGGVPLRLRRVVGQHRSRAASSSTRRAARRCRSAAR